MKTLFAVPGVRDSIQITDSVTKIELGTFYNCTNLLVIHLKHKEPIDFRDSLRYLTFQRLQSMYPKALAKLIGMMNSIRNSRILLKCNDSGWSKRISLNNIYPVKRRYAFLLLIDLVHVCTKFKIAGWSSRMSLLTFALN